VYRWCGKVEERCVPDAGLDVAPEDVAFAAKRIVSSHWSNIKLVQRRSLFRETNKLLSSSTSVPDKTVSVLDVVGFMDVLSSNQLIRSDAINTFVAS
jgi:hypothetical protein